MGKLYLRPRQKFTPSVWYCDQPYGKNKIANTVKDICSKSGIEGNFTNHSLRATSASRMYQCNVPEQVIKEVTGHRSDCVRVYKCTSDQLREQASKTLVGENIESDVKRPKIDHNDSLDLNEDQKERLQSSLSACQIIKNVVRTRMKMRKKHKVGAERVHEIAKKIVKRSSNKIVTKPKVQVKKEGDTGRYVIDVNLNVNVTK